MAFQSRFSAFIILFFFILNAANAQILTDSNLPIVVISTDLNTQTNQPLEILDDPRILASMHIISRPDGARNYLTDVATPEFLNYN
ncbi:MAG: hypothetical protein RLZ77_840, partial [Bacteroidota bacterium]